MAGLTIEEILGAEDRPLVEMPIPEWGGSVYLRALTAQQLDILEQWEAENQDNIEGLRAKWAALGMHNADGTPMQMSASQAMELSQKNGAVIDRIRLKMLAMRREQAAATEDLEGNSEGVPSDASTAA